MTEKNNAVCTICGNPYYVCLSCKDSMKLHPYKSFTDSAEHYKVFQVVRGLSTGVYTKEEAKDKFKNIDLSDIESFRPHIKKIIEDVLKEEYPIKIVETIVEVTKDKDIEIQSELVADDNKIIEVNDEIVIDKPIYSRKRNYKTETE